MSELKVDGCSIVSNAYVYDLYESLTASGYPMKTDIATPSTLEKDLKRGKKLVDATKQGNQAHAQFLTGIGASFDLTLTNKCWQEAERYRFLSFVSSQSTMHRITKFNLDGSYTKYVDKRIIEIMKEKISQYNSLKEQDGSPEELAELYLGILYSNPAGFLLTARMTTNYRCLRNIYIQRKDHRLPEWKEFCKWIETLPYSKELLIS